MAFLHTVTRPKLEQKMHVCYETRSKKEMIEPYNYVVLCFLLNKTWPQKVSVVQLKNDTMLIGIIGCNLRIQNRCSMEKC